MDENKEVNSTDPKREKVRVIPLSAIDDAPDHPFQVRDDDEMAELVESISTFGVINPVIVRKGEGDRYELISGHRRKYQNPRFSLIGEGAKKQPHRTLKIEYPFSRYVTCVDGR